MTAHQASQDPYFSAPEIADRYGQHLADIPKDLDQGLENDRHDAAAGGDWATHVNTNPTLPSWATGIGTGIAHWFEGSGSSSTPQSDDITKDGDKALTLPPTTPP